MEEKISQVWAESEIINFSDFPEQIVPGYAYFNMPNRVYHKSVFLGSSQIKNVDRSFEYFQHCIDESEDTESLAIEKGSGLHLAMESLIATGTTELFDKTVLDSPTKSIPSKAYLELRAENPDAVILPEEHQEDVRKMAKNMYEVAMGEDLLMNGYSELSFFWESRTGLLCKCRPDYIRFDIPMKVGFKTTKNHNQEGFPKEIANFGYHVSLAHYLEGIYEVTGVWIDEVRFVVGNNTPPFEAEIYRLSIPSLSVGQRLLEKYYQAILRGPVPKKTKSIDIPYWAMKEVE